MERALLGRPGNEQHKTPMPLAAVTSSLVPSSLPPLPPLAGHPFQFRASESGVWWPFRDRRKLRQPLLGKGHIDRKPFAMNHQRTFLRSNGGED